MKRSLYKKDKILFKNVVLNKSIIAKFSKFLQNYLLLFAASSFDCNLRLFMPKSCTGVLVELKMLFEVDVWPVVAASVFGDVEVKISMAFVVDATVVALDANLCFSAFSFIVITGFKVVE